MIVDTLPVFYYEKMVGYMTSSFADLVFAGERIEVGLRRGKFDYAALTSTRNRRSKTAKKEEGDTHAVTSAPTWPKSQQTPHNPTYEYSPHQPNYSTSKPLPIRLSSNKDCPLNHKGLPQKNRFPHNLDPPKTPIPTRTPSRGGISQKESPRNSPRYQCLMLTYYHF